MIETLTPAPLMSGNMSDRVVDRDDIRHMATLARIDLDEDSIDAYVEDCIDILNYFDRLEEVPDTDPIETENNVFRADTPGESLSHEEASRNGSIDADGYFRGPPVS